MDRDFEERERVRLAEQREYEKRLRREEDAARATGDPKPFFE